MKKHTHTSIDLGNGFYFNDGEIKNRVNESTECKEWMTWDEGWKWVISLKKIEERH